MSRTSLASLAGLSLTLACADREAQTSPIECEPLGYPLGVTPDPGLPPPEFEVRTRPAAG